MDFKHYFRRLKDVGPFLLVGLLNGVLTIQLISYVVGRDFLAEGGLFKIKIY